MVNSYVKHLSLYDHTRLWDALRRSFLVNECYMPTSSDISLSTGRSFTLETVIETGGSNLTGYLSVGEKSLLSLARTLVRDQDCCLRRSYISLFDRWRSGNLQSYRSLRASVDLETDSKTPANHGQNSSTRR